MSADTIADRRLHPLTVVLRLVGDMPSTLLGLPVLFTALSSIGWSYILLVMAGSIALFGGLQWIAWTRFKYGIGASDVVIESGLINRSRRTIPFDRIQDVDFERGPLQRVFGLAKVRIETGGASKDEGTLDSLSMEEAERLRLAVRAGQGRRSALAEPTAVEDTAIFAMSLRRVIVSGLFNFSLLWIAGIFAALNQLGDLFPFEISDAARWTGMARDELAGRLTIGAAIVLGLLAIALGLVTGIVRTLLRDFAYRLTSEPDGFRRARGLLTRTEVVIPKRRIQLALVQCGPLRRALGWAMLRFQTLGSGEEKGDGGLQDAAPFARPPEIDAILGDARGLARPDPGALTRVSSKHVWKPVIAGIFIPIVPIAIGIFFQPLALFALALIPLFVAAAIIERRWHRYAFDGDLISIQSGWWRRKIWILPVAGIQTVTLSRSWLQRRLSLASLAFDTAGASMFGSPKIADMRTDIAEDLAAIILERNRQSRQ